MAALKFPGYIPGAVRDYIIEIMEGANGAPGYVSLRDGKARELLECRQRLDALATAGEDDSVLRQEYEEIKQSHAYFEAQVACMQRFVDHENMKAAYAFLVEELEDHQWEHFLYSAWAALKNYQNYRDRLGRAKKVRDEITATADKLADLLNEILEIGLNYPPEFFLIRTLLENTDNNENDDECAMWQAMRPTLLGLPPQGETPPKNTSAKDSSDEPPSILINLPEAGKTQEPTQDDPAARLRSHIDYAWQKAPYLSALLETLAQAARDHEPRETEVIAAAISSRKRNPKSEYLRAFVTLLTEKYHIELSQNIKNAMALVAVVALNDPDRLDVTYDDVCKIIASLKNKLPEDSAEK